VTHGSAGRTVAILDSGIFDDASLFLAPDGFRGHPDLRGKVADRVNFTIEPDTDDYSGHGTHVAGIVAAATNNGVAGVGYLTRLLNVKVGNADGSVATSAAVAGIRWAADNGANVINMSFQGAGTCSPVFQDAIDYAWARNVVIVAAAGNDSNSELSTPAGCQHVIAVASTDSNDAKSSFSNFGGAVQVAAPGGFNAAGPSILSTSNLGDYIELAGTSMAAPYVSGVAALVWATGFGTSNQAVVSRLFETADHVPGTGTYWTYGRINAAAAVGPSATPTATATHAVTSTSSPTSTRTATATSSATSTATFPSLPSATATAPPTGAWTTTSSMANERARHTASLLSDGGVLVVGGEDNSGDGAATFARAELYDPVARTWTSTGSLHTGRMSHAASVLLDGRVLVTGGFVPLSSDPLGVTASAEIYDPRTGAWTQTASMSTRRSNHTSTLLDNGQVLISGGYDYSTGLTLSGAEIYDPLASTWTSAGTMSSPRAELVATKLADGRVLVTGGSPDNYDAVASTNLFDPGTRTWQTVADMGAKRLGHVATLLNSGKVLVAGGFNTGSRQLASTEIFDPTTGRWMPTADMTVPREDGIATLLNNGAVLVTGGEGVTGAEVYDPAAGTWASTSGTNQRRALFTATLLNNGQVLAAGGDGAGATAELFVPGNRLHQSRQPRL
jgi:hypothetical protein